MSRTIHLESYIDGADVNKLDSVHPYEMTIRSGHFQLFLNISRTNIYMGH